MWFFWPLPWESAFRCMYFHKTHTHLHIIKNNKNKSFTILLDLSQNPWKTKEKAQRNVLLPEQQKAILICTLLIFPFLNPQLKHTPKYWNYWLDNSLPKPPSTFTGMAVAISSNTVIQKLSLWRVLNRVHFWPDISCITVLQVRVSGNHQGDAGWLREWLTLAMHGLSRRWQQLLTLQQGRNGTARLFGLLSTFLEVYSFIL